nr:MAG: 5'/3'-nucleotidase SurE [Bacillota bacterium]
MRILLTNDDGVYAEGLQALREALEELPDVELYIVAPDRERSASGHAITLHRPIFPTRIEMPGTRAVIYSVSGTPADCAKLAIEELLPGRPDLVISGINHGPNLGTDVIYSGTVSAAIEGTILGIPAVAVSLCTFGPGDYTFAAQFTRDLALRVVREGLPRGTLLNVNIPPVSPAQCAGVAITKLGVRLYKNQWDRRVDPRGKVYYWLAGEVMELHNDPDSDVVAVQNNLISITPLQLDMTDYRLRERLKGWSFPDPAPGN